MAQGGAVTSSSRCLHQRHEGDGATVTRAGAAQVKCRQKRLLCSHSDASVILQTFKNSFIYFSSLCVINVTGRYSKVKGGHHGTAEKNLF